MILLMAPILLGALLIDAVFGLWRPGWLREVQPQIIRDRALIWLHDTLTTPAARHAAGLILLVLSAAAALAVWALLSVVPLAGLWSLLLGAWLLGMKRMSHAGHAVSNALRGAPDTVPATLAQLTKGTIGSASNSGAISTALTAVDNQMSRHVLSPALWFLVTGLPGLIFLSLLRLLAHARADDITLLGSAPKALDTLVNLPADRLVAWGVSHFDPVSGPQTAIAIDARIEAHWKIWLCLLAVAAILTLL